MRDYTPPPPPGGLKRGPNKPPFSPGFFFGKKFWANVYRGVRGLILKSSALTPQEPWAKSFTPEKKPGKKGVGVGASLNPPENFTQSFYREKKPMEKGVLLGAFLKPPGGGGGM